MHTKTAKRIAKKRIRFMKAYLKQMAKEIQ
jgi:HD superfamily phosphodiesterase